MLRLDLKEKYKSVFLWLGWEERGVCSRWIGSSCLQPALGMDCTPAALPLPLFLTHESTHTVRQNFSLIYLIVISHNSIFLLVYLNNSNLFIEFSKEWLLNEMFYFQVIFPFRGFYDIVDILVKQFKMMIITYV